MPFPILRTPFVVLSEIISLLEPNQLVTASLCSKKVRRLLKNHYQKRKPPQWRLSMFALSSQGNVDIITRTVNNRTDVIMAKHISELAGAAHKSIEINGYISTFDYENVNASDNIRFNGKLGPVDVLLFDSNAYWVTYHHLVNFDCIKLFVSSSILCESDVNSFLRHWRAGGSSRLVFLRLFFKNMYTFIKNFDEDLEIVETNEVRRFRVVAEEDVDEILGNYSIQRRDGVKATISCELGYFTMVVWHADGN